MVLLILFRIWIPISKYLGPSVKCLTCFPTWANNRNVKQQKLQNVLALPEAMWEILLNCMIYILKAIEKHKIKMKQLEIMFYNFWIEIDKNCQCDLGWMKWLVGLVLWLESHHVCLRHSKLKAMIVYRYIIRTFSFQAYHHIVKTHI